MVGQQRTFELIPTTLVHSTNQSRRMTSKQVKKEYQKKNKGPKISRAEQRRLEAVEIAKQKTEYERERASARSKAAREKKAAKEQAERAERKKNGIPEPSKFVRASQPTISMFVKKGNKRQWEEMEAVTEDSEGTVCDQEEQAAKRIAIHDDSDDEFGDFPSLSQSNLPELLAGIDSPAKTHTQMQPIEGEVEELIEDSDLQNLPPPRVGIRDEEYFDDDEDALANMVTTQLLSEADKKDDEFHSFPTKRRYVETTSHDVVNRDIQQKLPGTSANGISGSLAQQRSIFEAIGSEIRDSEGNNNQCPALQYRSKNMQSPPMKSAKSISFAATPPRLKHLSKALSQQMLPPSTTQAFLETHLDDFFPSPSQEIRELLDGLDDIPSNTQVAKELNSSDSIEIGPLTDIISTEKLDLSSQYFLEIDTPSRASTNIITSRLPTNSSLPKYISRPRSRFFMEKDDDLLRAALYESNIQVVGEEPKVVPLNESSAAGNRTFHRIRSIATDYGDEEFNEQELLALC